MKSKVILSLLCGALVAGTAQSSFAEAFCKRCPNDCRVLGIGHDDCKNIDPRGDLCCVDLNKKGRKIVEERREDAAESRAYDRETEHCPAGWQQTERKCTPEERRHGCKDVRLSNGLGCVKR